MRVLFLAHSFPRSPEDPVGSFVLRLAAALRPLGAEVLAIAPAAPGLPFHEVIEGVAVERFRYAPRRFETLAYSGTMRHQVRGSWAGRAAMLSFLASDFWRGLRSRRRFRAELIHAHWWYPGGLVGSWLKRWWRVPLVTTLHGTDLRAAQGVAVARPLFRHVLRRSDRVTVVSQWLADGVTALAARAHPVVAPMPVLPDLFSPPPPGTRPRNRLLFVGKLNEQKGIMALFHALAKMQAKPTVDVVVGVGSTPEDVRPLADSLGIAGQLHWYPLLTQPELARRYREATALVAPFRDEGLGLVAIEAQLSEAPVVAFRSGGLTDIVVHERTGLLVPPGDRGAEVAALAAALDRLLALPDQGAEWGREGRRHALATFAPEATARRYLEIYREALEPRRP
jgi:glycosyltransferase involved in cell wall biosynthesis